MKFRTYGMMAIAPSALNADYSEAFATNAHTVSHGAVAVIPIRGPLTNHCDAEFDSYEEIKARTFLALKSGARDIIWRIDSPGGLVSGCFDTVVEVRRMIADAGARLTAYAEQASSASYALACAASRIIASASASVGSIGVIETVLDTTAKAASEGVKIVLVTSGARKADCNPLSQITDAALAASQTNVDIMAGLFFDLVSEARGLSVDTIRKLEAAQMPGTVAHAIGLVDEIGTFDQALAIAASGVAAATETEGKAMKAKEMIAALKAKAESDDDDAQEARAALAEFNDDDDKPDAKAEDEGDDDKPDAKAEDEGDDDKPDAKAEDDDEKEAKAAASAGTSARAFSAKVSSIFRKEYRAVQEEAKRDQLLTSRPDLQASVRKELGELPLAVVERMLAGIPVVKSAAQNAIAGALAGGPVGGGTPLESSKYDADLDRQMGLTAITGGTRNEGTKLILSAGAAKVTK